jgi:ribose transport system substrate-binding protein
VILDGLVAKGYKGIAVFPSDPVAGNAQISKMVEQGITVVSLGGCPNQPTKALFCIATDQNTFAYKEAKQLIEALGGKGKIVHLTGMLADVNAQKYIKAVEQAVAEYPGVELVQTIGDLDTAEPAQNAVSNLLAAKRDQIDGIVASSHFSSLAVAAKMRELDEKRIKVVTINTDPSVLAAIKDGYVLGTMAQNAYGQAYLAVYSLKLLADGYTWKKDAPFEIDSGLFLVRAPNIDTVPQDLANLTKQLQADWKEKYFDPPK